MKIVIHENKVLLRNKKNHIAIEKWYKRKKKSLYQYVNCNILDEVSCTKFEHDAFVIFIIA